MLRTLSQLGLLLAFATLIGCSGSKGTPSYNPNVGPFDEDGNYVEAWADNPPKRNSRRRSSPAPKPKPRVAPLPKPNPKPRVTPKPKPKPKPVVKPKPKPKPVVKPKPKPKPKPKVIRHTVKKGDTLYGLSRRYGTSVSAIQKANGIKGTTIGIGKVLVIPK